MLNDVNIKDEAILVYRSGVGMWAFVLHRLTGLSLMFYLLMHIVVISTSLHGPNAFNRLLAVLTSPPFMVADLALLAAILFHGFNGLRIIFFDLGIGIRQQKFIFWLVMLIAAIGWFWTLSMTWPYIFIIK